MGNHENKNRTIASNWKIEKSEKLLRSWKPTNNKQIRKIEHEKIRACQAK